MRGQFRAWLAAMTARGRVTQTVGDDQTLIEFVYHEARLIDEKRFDEWYELISQMTAAIGCR